MWSAVNSEKLSKAWRKKWQRLCSRLIFFHKFHPSEFTDKKIQPLSTIVKFSWNASKFLPNFVKSSWSKHTVRNFWQIRVFGHTFSPTTWFSSTLKTDQLFQTKTSQSTLKKLIKTNWWLARFYRWVTSGQRTSLTAKNWLTTKWLSFKILLITFLLKKLPKGNLVLRFMACFKLQPNYLISNWLWSFSTLSMKWKSKTQKIARILCNVYKDFLKNFVAQVLLSGRIQKVYTGWWHCSPITKW